MSQDLLEKILKNKVDKNLEKTIKFLLTYKKDDFIYPSVIKRKLKFEDKKVYEILSVLENNKIIKMYYEIFCYNCNRTIGLFEYFSQLEENMACENCEGSLNSMDNVKVVYKVVK